MLRSIPSTLHKTFLWDQQLTALEACIVRPLCIPRPKSTRRGIRLVPTNPHGWRILAQVETVRNGSSVIPVPTFHPTLRFLELQVLGSIAAIVTLIVIGVVVGVVVSKNHSTRTSSSSGGSNSGSPVNQTNPDDPSTFVKNPLLHQSFYGMAYTPAGSQLPNCGNKLSALLSFLFASTDVINTFTRRCHH